MKQHYWLYKYKQQWLIVTKNIEMTVTITNLPISLSIHRSTYLKQPLKLNDLNLNRMLSVNLLTLYMRLETHENGKKYLKRQKKEKRERF